MLNKNNFDVSKWAELHRPHNREDGTPHPTGYARGIPFSGFISFRVHREKAEQIWREDKARAHLNAILTLWFYRQAKRGVLIQQQEAYEISYDENVGHLYVKIDGVEYDPRWACIFASHYSLVEERRREQEKGMAEALANLQQAAEEVEQQRDVLDLSMVGVNRQDDDDDLPN